MTWTSADAAKLRLQRERRAEGESELGKERFACRVALWDGARIWFSSAAKYLEHRLSASTSIDVVWTRRGLDDEAWTTVLVQLGKLNVELKKMMDIESPARRRVIWTCLENTRWKDVLTDDDFRSPDYELACWIACENGIRGDDFMLFDAVEPLTHKTPEFLNMFASALETCSFEPAVLGMAIRKVLKSDENLATKVLELIGIVSAAL